MPQSGCTFTEPTQFVMMRAGIRIDRRGRNIRVPQIVAGERNEAVETRGLADRHSAAGEIAATGPTAEPPLPPLPPLPPHFQPDWRRRSRR